MATATQPILEHNTTAFLEKLATAGGPPIYKLTPEEARNLLRKVQQSYPVKAPEVKIEDRTIPTGPDGQLAIRIVRPAQAKSKLSTIVYMHGAGWILGDQDVFDRLIRELAVKAQVALVFVKYSLSPEARFPKAIEEGYAAAKYVKEHGAELNLDTARLAIGGDSVGGNMATVITLLAKERNGPKFDFQLLFYPVTSSSLNTPSYQEFAEGPWLTKEAMKWFWNAYEPDESKRSSHHHSPLNASTDQLKGLPPALILTAEFDVLRDEGEAYAHKLIQAGVNVKSIRMLGTIHDYVMLNALVNNPSTQEAIQIAADCLHKALTSS